MSRSVISLAALVATLSGALPALAVDVRIDVGLRLAHLTIDEDLEFSCDCDPDTDPGCTASEAPGVCQPATLDEPHEGFMYGALIGASARGGWWAGGLRLAAAIGAFEPVDDEKVRPEADELISLTHVTLEIPLEVHAGLSGVEVFAQVAPRFGVLNYSEDNLEEDADTFTAGVMFTAGVRFGATDGWHVGAGGGGVAHSSFGGWAVEAMVHKTISPGAAKQAADDAEPAPAEAPADTPAVAPAEPPVQAPEAPEAPDAPEPGAPPPS